MLRERYISSFPYYLDTMNEAARQAASLIDPEVENFLIFDEDDFNIFKSKVLVTLKERRKSGMTVKVPCIGIDRITTSTMKAAVKAKDMNTLATVPKFD